MRPLAPVPSSVRKLPARQPSGTSDDVPGSVNSLPQASTVGHASLPTEAPPRPATVSGRPPVVAPLASDLYKIQFTVSRETHDKRRQAQDLLRHSVRDGDPAAIFNRALTLLLTELRKKTLAYSDATEKKGASLHETHDPSGPAARAAPLIRATARKAVSCPWSQQSSRSRLGS